MDIVRLHSWFSWFISFPS